MRLLNIHTLEFRYFLDADRPPYDILSHRWEGDETTLQQFEAERHLPPHKQGQGVSGTRKILRYCELLAASPAAAAAVEWCWVDTCCIDKTSSAELTEAINSMFAWYRQAERCTVYLNDVDAGNDDDGDGNGDDNDDDDDEDDDDKDNLSTEKKKKMNKIAANLQHSVWFNRGWTLQELIAPSRQVFFDRNWVEIGDRGDLLGLIEQATGIPGAVMGDAERVEGTCVAQRMSWAAGRMTSRVEDMAYCLLGVFGVNMPLIYGEGARAFERLQLEILKVSDDETIFAWKGDYALSGMLATRPADFAYRDVARIRPRGSIERPPYAMTNRGLQFYTNRTLDERDFHTWLPLDCAFATNTTTTSNSVYDGGGGGGVIDDIEERVGNPIAICVARIDKKLVRVHCNNLVTDADSVSYKQYARGLSKKGKVPEPVYIAQFSLPDADGTAASASRSICANTKLDKENDNGDKFKIGPWPSRSCYLSHYIGVDD